MEDSYIDIEEVTLEKDLGVQTTFNLDSSLQCQKAASAVMRMPSMIKLCQRIYPFFT